MLEHYSICSVFIKLIIHETNCKKNNTFICNTKLKDYFNRIAHITRINSDKMETKISLKSIRRLDPNKLNVNSTDYLTIKKLPI